MGTEPAGQQVTDIGTAGVIARPPLMFLVALVVGFVSDRLLPLPLPVPRIDAVHLIVGGALILIGLGLAAAGIRNFSRTGTPVPTNRPTKMLMTSGIHGWTRNPIYLGMFLLYCGIGIATRSPWILIPGLPLGIAIRYFAAIGAGWADQPVAALTASYVLPIVLLPIALYLMRLRAWQCQHSSSFSV